MARKKPLEKISSIIADKRKITKALKKGIETALLKHKQAGQPIVIWQNNRVVWIPAEKIIVKQERKKS